MRNRQKFSPEWSRETTSAEVEAPSDVTVGARARAPSSSTEMAKGSGGREITSWSFGLTTSEEETGPDSKNHFPSFDGLRKSQL